MANDPLSSSRLESGPIDNSFLRRPAIISGDQQTPAPTPSTVVQKLEAIRKIVDIANSDPNNKTEARIKQMQASFSPPEKAA